MKNFLFAVAIFLSITILNVVIFAVYYNAGFTYVTNLMNDNLDANLGKASFDNKDILAYETNIKE